MNDVRQAIDLRRAEWADPREAIHRGEKCPVLLNCRFDFEPAEGLSAFPLSLPKDVVQFWQIAKQAWLFKDNQYGQWGIEVLAPSHAVLETSRQRSARPKDFLDTDLVLARFCGDSDLVMIACNPASPDFGVVTIATPLDVRNDWPIVARDVGEFLTRLAVAQGDKYWESHV